MKRHFFSRHSITLRLILNFGIVLLVFSAIIGLSIQLFLRSLVTTRAKRALSESVDELTGRLATAGRQIDEDFANAQDSVAMDIALNNNIQIIVRDSAGNEYSTVKNSTFLTPDGNETEEYGGTFRIMYSETAKNDRIFYLVYVREIPGGFEIEARSHYTAVDTALLVTNTFSRTIIISSLFLALAWTLMFSRMFTRPVIQMTNTAKALSNLNFDTRCSVESDDELGELAESINEMSDKLKEAIDKMQEQNAQLAAELEKEKKLEQMRKKFISDVSHELKTPLTIISGYAESLAHSVNKSEKKREDYSRVILDESAKMTKLVHDLLNLSQYESGSYKLAMSFFSVDTLIRGIVERYMTATAQKNIKVKMQCIPCDLYADPLRVEQVVNNLFSNAVSHADGDKRIEIVGRIQEGSYCISIFNTGSAIPDEDAAKIWDAFYKADKSRAREEGRYGIGLSIVRALVELHHGTCRSENLEGGVMFTVTFPIVSEADNG